MIMIEKKGKSMNILMMLANSFTHDPRVYNEARSLIKAGHNVTVLGWDRKKANPPKDVKDGITVVRSYNTKFMNLLPYDIFKLHLWWNKGYKDASELYKKNSFDIIHCHDFNTLPIGVKLKKKYGLPLIYDAHEIWGYMVEKDLPKWWADYYLKKEKRIIRYVDRVITVNEPLRKYYSKITHKPITIIMNCKQLQDTKYEPPNNDKFTLLYLGGLDKSRFLLELVNVVKELPDVHCIIGGIGKPEYVKILKYKCSQVQNVNFIGKVPMEKVLPITKKADVVVCMLDPINKNSRVGLPNKVFEAAVCGRPLIITEGLYYEKIVVEKERYGLAIQHTKEGLRDAIIKLRDNPILCEELGRNALKVAIEEFNWIRQEEKLMKVYKDLEK